MSEIQYSNRELDAHFREVKDTLARIEAQTTKTNGRVTSLERNESKRNGQITVIQWGLGVLTAVFIGFVLSLIQ